MQYLIYDTEDDTYTYTLIDFSDEVWAGSWFNKIGEWDGTWTKDDNTNDSNIEKWLLDMPSCVVLLEHENITPKLLKQYPELLV